MKRIVAAILILLSSVQAYAQSRSVTVRNNGNDLMYVSITVSGYRMGDVIVDTGSNKSLLAYEDYVEMKRRGIISRDNFAGYVNIRTSANTVARRESYCIDGLDFLGFRLDNVVVIFDTSSKISRTRIIGMNILGRFDKIEYSPKRKELTVSL